MPNHFDVAILIGSLRKASLTRKVAQALTSLAPERLRCRIVEIGDLQMYNQDLDDHPPASWIRLRKDIATAQAVLILTPEYNRSVPACLKNALDIGSRPAGENAWNGKPTGVVSVTPYKLGAFGANQHVRQALVYLNMPVMQQPEAYIGGAAELFDEQGKLKNAETQKILKQYMTAFERWVATLLSEPSDRGVGQRITPCLWFDGNAEEAARFYAGVFPDSRVTAVHRAPGDYPAGKTGNVLIVEFTLQGQPFTGLNGGPNFRFNEAISFQIPVDTQEQADRYVEALSAVPEAEQCGWLKDRFGVSWQIVPRQLMKLFSDPDPGRAKRAFEAMMQMKRIDIAGIERAARGAGVG